jgi:hypothetical protein
VSRYADAHALQRPHGPPNVGQADSRSMVIPATQTDLRMASESDATMRSNGHIEG